MTYLIIDHCSNKILLSAYLNPNDTYYIRLTQDVTDDSIDKNYILPNIIFGEPETQTDAILWDEQSLSIDDIMKLNEYLEIDKPAYVGSLYCEELEQLLDYEPFLGNSSCSVPEKMSRSIGKKVFVTKHELVKSIDFVQTIFDMGYKIVTLGDYQKLVPEDKVKVYNPTKNIDIDIENIEKLLSYGDTAFIPSISTNELTDYETELVNKLLDTIKFNEKILLLNYFDFIVENFKYNYEDYDKLMFSDRLIRDTKYCEQYSQIFYGAKGGFYKDLQALFDKDKYNDFISRCIDIKPIGTEWISTHNSDIQFSQTFREKHPDIWHDVTDRFDRRYDVNLDELLYNDFGLITEDYQEILDKKEIKTVKIPTIG